ncbi:MAG: PAS domain-containing protein [Alphaproteobacteria bacterium]|nr:PAS domain-containing protein [Alphaproteobacteria bacterium]
MSMRRMSDGREPEENLSALSNSQLVAAVARLQRRVATLENELEEHRHGVTEAGESIPGGDRLRLQRLELAVQATNDGVWDWDIVNKRIWQSAPLRHLYGYAESELEEQFDIDDESDSWCAGLHPEDRPLWARTLRDHLRDDTPYKLEFRYRMPAGDYRWIGTIGQAIRDGEGTPIRMVGSNRDITDRVNTTDALRASEARLEEAQQTAQVGNWEYFPATDRLVWSAETHRIFGTSPGDFHPTLEGFRKLVHPDDRERLRGVNDEFARTGKQTSYEHRIVLDSGEIRWVHQVNEPFDDDKGETESRRGTVQLITERKLAEQALKNSEASWIACRH